MELLTVGRTSGIRLEGELDMSTAPALEEALRPAVDEGGAILIDLSGLTFMDSTGIGAFIRAAVALRERGCIVLHGEGDRVRRVLDLARLDGSVPNLHRVSHIGRQPEISVDDEATAKPVSA